MNFPEIGQWTVDDFKNQFDLGKREGIGSGYNADAGATDSDQTKSNAILGKGYMSNDDYERLKGDKAFRKLYEQYGDRADQVKSGEWDIDEMSINHMDGFLDDFAEKLVDKPTPEKSETFDTQIPDQIVNARNTIQDFNDNYSKIWKHNPEHGNNNSFMDSYTFSGKNVNSAPTWNGSNMKVSMTTQWGEGATDHSVGAGETTFKYANARDRAQSFSNQQVPGETLGMP